MATALLTLGAVSAVASIAFALLPSAWTVIRLPVGLAIDATTVFLVVTGIVWRWQTGQIRTALRDEEGSQRFGSVWVLAVAVFIIVDCGVAKVMGGPDPVHRVLLMGTVVRLISIAFAAAVVLAVRQDVRNVLIGEIRIGPLTDSVIHYDVGLIQPTAGASVHFQLVLPSRMSDFLINARGARRSGLYYATDPGTRTRSPWPPTM